VLFRSGEVGEFKGRLLSQRELERKTRPNWVDSGPADRFPPLDK
jgi:hypothetical protein